MQNLNRRCIDDYFLKRTITDSQTFIEALAKNGSYLAEIHFLDGCENAGHFVRLSFSGGEEIHISATSGFFNTPEEPVELEARLQWGRGNYIQDMSCQKSNRWEKEY